ncbi:transcription antiterminator [Neobacillus sp. MM2021_6]|uniref:BglG family transcription antiterminator n=1 Tax=Bacillaceae TaxID=186817 RepID=UPI001407944C|nr:MULTISPECIES: BglG family transcription antiterminator [Bacillaceae]MBO0959865.1 transcription antiterminator [Neobacillus sp. MM2021_6]NHC20487.1 transcription antiterminator [Bacillus sp. MM2020_4]
MMIDKRPAFLLNYLLKMKNTTMNQVMEHTQLTKRQIYYDLEKINHWLKERELPAIPFRGIHYIEVPKEVGAYFREQQDHSQDREVILTEEERLNLIILYLFIREEPISSVHLTQLLQVSKNTVISDVKKANEMNRPFLVEIRYSRQSGYHLKGTEFDKRVIVMHCLSQVLSVPYFEKLIDYLVKNRTGHIPFEDIHHTLLQMETQFELHFVEERIKQFAYFLLLYHYRLKERKFVPFHADEMKLVKMDPMWRVSQTLTELLRFEGVDTELCYLTIQLLGLSLGNRFVQDMNRDLLFKICEQLVFDFESKACIVFEKKDEVIHSLYQHLKPAYFRMKYRIPIDNPLLEQIKHEHKELYTIVKEMLQPFGTLLSITIPEEEIGFITMHFGAMLKRPKQEMPKKKRAIVVCPSGISSSLMVKHQLESLFSEITVERNLSLQEFQKQNLDHYDLLFSTVTLDTTLPCFYVKPIMTPNEKNSLVNEVYQHLFGIQYQDISVKELIQTIGKFANVYDEKGLKTALSQLTFQKKVEHQRGNQPVLNDLLTAETVQIVEQVSDWEEAVKVAARPLLETGIIESSYIEAMIGNIKTFGPYVVIGPEVAIPHARPEMGVHHVGMSFLKLNQPVNFLEDEKYPVRLLFCIAAIDNTTHLKALSQLTKLLSEKNNIDLLKETESTDQIFALFKQYSAVV